VRDNQIHWEIKKKMSKRKAETEKQRKKVGEKKNTNTTRRGFGKTGGISEGSGNRNVQKRNTQPRRRGTRLQNQEISSSSSAPPPRFPAPALRPGSQEGSQSMPAAKRRKHKKINNKRQSRNKNTMRTQCDLNKIN